MSWHYLQEGAADYSEVCCAGGEPWRPLKLKSMHGRFYCNGKLTESYLTSLSGTTSVPSTENPGAEKLTLSAAVSHAKTSASPAKAQESPANGQDYGASLRELSVRYDPATSSWKTHQCLWEEVLPESSVILPKWGMMRAGVLSEHITPAHLISETESGSSENWPTPTRSDYRGRGPNSSQQGLPDVVKRGKLWPTPCATDHKGSGVNGQLRDRLDYAIERGATKSKVYHGGMLTRRTYPTPRCFAHKDALRDRGKSNLGEVINDMEQVTRSGQLNPEWVELLMGWPKQWTCLDPINVMQFNQWLMGFNKEIDYAEKNRDPEEVQNLRKQVYPSYGREAWKNGTWETSIPRVCGKIANRVDRLKAIGNGQVPAVVKLAWETLYCDH